MNLPLRTRRWKGEEGGSVVETAILMVILAPMILYTFYVSELGLHLLDVQEATISTVWDLSTQSYSNIDDLPMTARSNAPTFIDGTVAAYNRAQYGDHDSAYSGEARLGAGGKQYTGQVIHTTAFAQASWCNGGNCQGNSSYDTKTQAAPPRCSLQADGLSGGLGSIYATDLTGGAAYYATTASAGGVATCWSKAWVFNYLLPKSLLGGFGRADKVKPIDKKTHREANPESISGVVSAGGTPSGGSTDQTGDMLLRSKAGLFVDTWAVGDNRDVKRSDGFFERGTGPNKQFFNRTAVVFSYPIWFGEPALRVGNYALKARQNKLANILVAPENPLLPVGANALEFDNPMGLALSAHYESGTSPNIDSYKDQSFFTTPLYNQFRTMWNNRGNNYLGMRTAQLR